MCKQIVRCKPIVLFDGACGMCSQLVDFVLRNESSKTLLFVPNDSEYGRLLSDTYCLNIKIGETIILIDGEGVHLYSDAVLRIVRFLRFPWSWLRYGVWIPRYFRDSVYRLVARNRYRFRGRIDPKCIIFSEEDKGRIIECLPKDNS